MQCLDTYRLVHPFLGGYTVSGKFNVLAKNNTCERSDYILYWDFLGEKVRIRLQDLQCSTIQVKPFGETPQNQVSAHFALEAHFILKQ